MSFLADMLSGVGSVLSAPRRLLYENVVSPLAGREVKGFGDLIGVDEDSDWSGKALGFLGDVATDPLTWAGGLAARGLRNALFAGPKAALGKSAAPAASLATPAGMRGAAEQVPVLYGTKMAAVEPAASGLSAGQKGAALVSDVGPSGMALTAELTPGSAVLGEKALMGRSNDLRNLFERAGSMPGDAAAYDRATRTILTPMARPALSGGKLSDEAIETIAARRHERIHSMVDAASRNPELRAQLPLAGRMAAGLRNSEVGAGKALGRILDEVAAYGGMTRNGGFRNAGSFLFNPRINSQYVPQLLQESPLVAALYSALPYTIPAGGGAAGYSLSQLGG